MDITEALRKMKEARCLFLALRRSSNEVNALTDFRRIHVDQIVCVLGVRWTIELKCGAFGVVKSARSRCGNVAAVRAERFVAEWCCTVANGSMCYCGPGA
jgi:hypothetical protein